MPDLEQAARTEWLTALRPAAANEWPPAIRAIETEADNAKRLQALGSILDEIPQEELPDLSTALREGPLRDDLRAVMAQLGAARLMRLLHWLAEIDPPRLPCRHLCAGRRRRRHRRCTVRSDRCRHPPGTAAPNLCLLSHRGAAWGVRNRS